MESREENALNEWIASRWRSATSRPLIAATEAELRAKESQRSSEGRSD